MNKKVYVGVIGERICNDESSRVALEIGELIAKENWVLICGGRGGIMEKACYGAVKNGGVTIGILPGDSRDEGNPFLTYSIVTGLGETRNSIVVRNSDVIVAISGSYGTLTEIAFARLFNIPVVGIRSWSFAKRCNEYRKLLDYETSDPFDAIRYIKKFKELNHGIKTC